MGISAPYKCLHLWVRVIMVRSIWKNNSVLFSTSVNVIYGNKSRRKGEFETIHHKHRVITSILWKSISATYRCLHLWVGVIMVCSIWKNNSVLFSTFVNVIYGNKSRQIRPMTILTPWPQTNRCTPGSAVSTGWWLGTLPGRTVEREIGQTGARRRRRSTNGGRRMVGAEKVKDGQ